MLRLVKEYIDAKADWHPYQTINTGRFSPSSSLTPADRQMKDRLIDAEAALEQAIAKEEARERELC